MHRLNALQLFVRVAEAGSLTKAAALLGVGQPAVSKQMASLEKRLGAQLMNRTARGLSLTAAGQDYYESAVRLLQEFEDAEDRVGRRQASPRVSPSIKSPLVADLYYRDEALVLLLG
jgi:DNA-binding transcriptional LysR family regulator